GQLQRTEGHDLVLPPAAVGPPAGAGHEVGVVLAEAGGGEDAGALVVAHATGRAGQGEGECAHGGLLGEGRQGQCVRCGRSAPGARCDEVVADPRGAAGGERRVRRTGCEVVLHGGAHRGGGLDVTEVVQQQSDGEHGGGGVGEVLPGDVR